MLSGLRVYASKLHGHRYRYNWEKLLRTPPRAGPVKLEAHEVELNE